MTTRRVSATSGTAVHSGAGTELKTKVFFSIKQNCFLFLFSEHTMPEVHLHVHVHVHVHVHAYST